MSKKSDETAKMLRTEFAVGDQVRWVRSDGTVDGPPGTVEEVCWRGGEPLYAVRWCNRGLHRWYSAASLRLTVAPDPATGVATPSRWAPKPDRA